MFKVLNLFLHVTGLNYFGLQFQTNTENGEKIILLVVDPIGGNGAQKSY